MCEIYFCQQDHGANKLSVSSVISCRIFLLSEFPNLICIPAPAGYLRENTHNRINTSHAFNDVAPASWLTFIDKLQV